MRLKIVGDGTPAGTEVVCADTGTPMCGATLKWIRVTGFNIEVEIEVKRFDIEISTNNTVSPVVPRSPPSHRPYFYVKVVGDGTFNFTKVVASDTDEDISCNEISLAIMAGGKPHPSLVLTLINPEIDFKQPVLKASHVTGSSNASSAPLGGGTPSCSPSYHPPGGFPSGPPYSQADPDAASLKQDSSPPHLHVWVTVPLFSSTITVCKICKIEKK